MIWPFKSKPPPAPHEPDEVDEMERRMPEGTRFEYLGKVCVVSHYVDWGAAEFGYGTAGLHFHYVDDWGVMREGVIKAHSLESYRKAGILK